MPALKDKLQKIQEERDKPLWDGPESETPNGGITQSMLNNFLVCRERFRIRYILGLQVPDDFNHRLEYGNFWHACEEDLAAGNTDSYEKLDLYTAELCKKYPLRQADIFKWYNICKVQFPIYQEYWAQHEDVQQRTPLMQEQVFCVPYQLPSGRTVYLRGKFDSVDLIDDKIWLQENKTKGDIDPVLMQRQLTFDLQTMLYLIALEEWTYERRPDGTRLGVSRPIKGCHAPISGVRYNVIRRPLSGGKGSIRQKKNQTEEEFYQELGEMIKGATGPEWGVGADEHYFFMRWKVKIDVGDIGNFKNQFLNPILENLCWWYDEQIEAESDYPPPPSHWRTPYGIYSPLYDGKPTDQDEFLASGSTVGLHRAESLFRELT